METLSDPGDPEGQSGTGSRDVLKLTIPERLGPEERDIVFTPSALTGLNNEFASSGQRPQLICPRREYSLEITIVSRLIKRLLKNQLVTCHRF